MSRDDVPAMNPPGATSDGPQGNHWDPFILRLKSYRERVGSPSYRVLAERVAEARVARGVDSYAARVGKTTVYDCFQTGRPRANIELLREVADALAVPASEVDEWVSSCHRSSTPECQPPAVEQEVVRSATVAQVALLMGACVGVNMLGRVLVDVLHLPLYLDMVGTCIAALALGPWRGAGVGVATNAIGAVPSGWVSLPFALVNLAGALVWGYGVRRGAMGRTLPRFFMLNVLAAVVCSAVAVPILIALYGEAFRDGHDMVTAAVTDVVPNLWAATALSNLLASTWDKLISGFVALVVLSALPAMWRRDFPLATVLYAQAERTRARASE